MAGERLRRELVAVRDGSLEAGGGARGARDDVVVGQADDAHDRPVAKSDLVGRVLRRDQVIGKPIAKRAFTVVDAILEQDDRVSELLGPWRLT